MSRTSIPKQAAVVSPLVPPSQIGQATRGKSDAAGSKKQATMSQAGTPMMRTASPHPTTATKANKRQPPRRRDENLRPFAIAGIKREAEASPLPETSNETTRRDDERYGHDATPHDTRRATRDETDNHGKTPQHHGQPRPTRRTDTMGRASTPRRPSPQDMEERATRRSTRRNDEKRTRRQAKDEGKHTATPQDKRMTLRHDETLTSRTARHDTRPPRATTTTTIRHETSHETARRDERSE